jgi:ribosomal protein L11 methyltransferase
MMINANRSKKSRAAEPSAPGWSYRLGPRLVLGDARWEPGGPASEKIITIKPGRAFPLGHPTTRLCLDLLTETLADRPGGNLVEVGCGTGVLCLAAAALGVPRVIGLDLARAAVRATRQNARANGLGGAIQVIQGSSHCLQARFDLVVANLPWEVQMDQVPELHRLTGPGGRLILSGFRDNQEEPLLASYQRLGWTLGRRLVKYFSHPELPPQISFNWVAWLLQSTGSDFSTQASPA